MSGGEALDLALGLLRAPARRTLLAARPLPSGMTTLLEVASGSPAAADEAAASLGADPAELLEAARFFVQQVLLADGADAYRIMGAHRHDDIARIRDHHRLLLRWLHPDRSGDEQWESILATRVNQAWNQLRTPAARGEYDRRLAAEPAAPDPLPAHDPNVPPPATGGRHHAGPAPGPRFAPGALAVAAVAIACIGLGWLAYQGIREPAAPDFHRVRAPLPAATPGPGTVAGPDLGAVAVVAAAAGPPPPVTRSDESVRLAAETARPAGRIEAQREASESSPRAIAVAELRGGRPVEPLSAAAPVVAASEAAVAPPAAWTVLPEAPEAAAPASSAEPSLEAPPLPSPGIVAPGAIAAITPVAPGIPAVDPAPSPRGSPATGPDLSTDALQLFESANSAVDALTGWLASSDDSHQPEYAHPSARLDAVDTRLRLYERLGQGPTGQLTLEDRDWRLGPRHATVDARYRLTLRGRERETGIAHIELARHESRWELASLSLVADP